MDFNHRSPPHRQNGNNNSNNYATNFHERSPYNNNDSSSMLHHINNTPKQKQTLNSETFYQHQHPSIYNSSSSNTKSSRRNLMERRRAKSECLSPSHSPNQYQPVKSYHNRDQHQQDAWSVHRSPRQLVNPIDDELDLEAEYNFPSWHTRNRYRASSESSSDYYYFRDNFPDAEDYRNKRSRESYSVSPGKYRSASHHQQQQQNSHRVTNKSSFSVLVNNSNHHQYRHSPKLKARSHYMSHKAGIVRVSSPLHKKRLEMWKSQSQSTNSNHSNHSNSNSSIPSNSIPSIDSHSASYTPKISPDDDEEDFDEEEEDPPGPEDQVDDDITDPEDTYESSLSLSYSERSLPALTLNTDCVLGGRVPGAPFSQSLFPFVPPYITFASYEEKGPEMPAVIHKQLKWKLTTITPLLVRKIILNTGFRLMKSKLKVSNIIFYVYFFQCC